MLGIRHMRTPIVNLAKLLAEAVKTAAAGGLPELHRNAMGKIEKSRIPGMLGGETAR